MICGCGSPIEKVRLEFGFKLCKSCAFSLPEQPRVKGRMVYSDKTAPEIEIMSADVFAANEKYFTGSHSSARPRKPQ